MITKIQFTTRGFFVALAIAFLGCWLAFAPTASAQQNLVLNPGFETGDFTNWTAVDAAAGTDYGVGTSAHSGVYAAYLAGVSLGNFDSISQNIHTQPGAKYKLTFWLFNSSNANNSEFQALWNGKVVFTTANVAFPYTKEVVLNLVATGPLSSLTFEGYQVPASYDLDDIDLIATQILFKQYALTPNQFAVAANLDQVVNDPRAASLINFLNNENTLSLPHDFDLIAPAALTSIFQISQAFADVQANNIENHLSDVRAGNAQPGGATSLLMATDGKSSVDAKDQGGKIIAATAPENRWNLWMEGNGNWVQVNGDFNAAGYRFATGGVTLGGDYRVCDHFVAGIMGGYANTGATVSQGGSVDVNSGKLGIYSTAFGSGFYLNTLAAGGYNNYDTHRTGFGGPAAGSTDGEEFDGLIGGGYDLHQGNVTLGPVVSAQYTYVGINGFTEAGSLAPLNILAQNQDSLRSKVGFKISSDWTVRGAKVTPSFTAGWQHEYLNSRFALDSSFASGAGTVFTASGPELGRDSVVVNAGVNVQWTPRLGTYLSYYGELGRTNYQLNSVTGGVSFGF